jgi:hypothetical protein
MAWLNVSAEPLRDQKGRTCHLAMSASEPRDRDACYELGRAFGGRGDDEADAAQDMSDEEEDASAKDIAVRAGPQEAEGICGRVCWNEPDVGEWIAEFDCESGLKRGRGRDRPE